MLRRLKGKENNMIDIKKIISEELSKTTELEATDLNTYIEIPKDESMGDYAFPCFRLAKELKKAPTIIATEIKEKINLPKEYIKKVEISGGYLNFFMNPEIGRAHV